MIHALLTLIFCILVWLLNLPILLYFLPTAFYLGREFTQAEYRYISTYGNGKRANMPWYGGFLPKVWNTKSILDWVLPLIVSFTMYFLNSEIH